MPEAKCFFTDYVQIFGDAKSHDSERSSAVPTPGWGAGYDLTVRAEVPPTLASPRIISAAGGRVFELGGGKKCCGTFEGH